MKRTFLFYIKGGYVLKKGLVLMIALLSMVLGAAAASADRIDNLWLSSDGAFGIDAISWYKEKDVHYLFVPGNVVKDELCIGFDGVDQIQVGEVTLAQGDRAAALPIDEMVTVSNGSHRYTVCVKQGSKGLPSLHILTESGSLEKVHQNKENKEEGELRFVMPDGEVAYDSLLSHIKMRGNSSTTFKKKNYQIKLDKGTDLMGMGKNKTWILTGNSRDKSLLRNQITMDMAMYAGLDYTPEHLSADVYINHEYMGVYLLSEKVMIDPTRIAIADLEGETEDLNDDVADCELVGSRKAVPGQYKAYAIEENPEDITGGYLIEFESYASRYKEEASAYHTDRKNTLVIKSPEFCSVEQMEYISAFMQAFENAIFSPNGVDEETGKHYSEWIDMDSLVKKYMIEEISKNYDGNNSSMFFYKPADEQSTLAFAGPVWDYDSSYGSYAQERNKAVLKPDGFWINSETGAKYWWPALYKQDDFKAAVFARYQETFAPALEILLGKREDPNGILKSLDEYAKEIHDSAQMNVVRWPALKNPSTVANTGHTFELNIEFLRTFLQGRYDFLEQEWR